MEKSWTGVISLIDKMYYAVMVKHVLPFLLLASLTSMIGVALFGDGIATNGSFSRESVRAVFDWSLLLFMLTLGSLGMMVLNKFERGDSK